jgi:GAF domain-containing protein
LLSAQASVAITNAELYEAEHRRAEEWRALFDLSRELTGTMELRALFDSVVERSASLLGADVTVLALLSGDGAPFYSGSH